MCSLPVSVDKIKKGNILIWDRVAGRRKIRIQDRRGWHIPIGPYWAVPKGNNRIQSSENFPPTERWINSLRDGADIYTHSEQQNYQQKIIKGDEQQKIVQL